MPFVSPYYDPNVDKNSDKFTADYAYPLVIGDLECLRDNCFQDADSIECFTQLLDAVKGGTCDVKDNPAFNPELNVTWYGTGLSVIVTNLPLATALVTGTCNAACARKLYEAQCIKKLRGLPSIIQNTILNVLKYSKNYYVYLCIRYKFDPVKKVTE